MPELAEVETVRRDLQGIIVGRTVKRAEVTGPRTVRRHSVEHLTSSVMGAKVVSVGRTGKYLHLHLDSTLVLNVHLRMSGQLRWHSPRDERAPHTHAVLGFTNGELRFVDPRTFGELFMAARDALPLAGADPLDELFSRAQFAALLESRRRPLKLVLMDQTLIGGIGNIYGDEICHRARVRTDRLALGLTAAEVGRVYRAMGEVLHAAVEARGSSLRDAQYVDLFGQPGGFQTQHRVYGREGLACLRCKGAVVRSTLGQRSTFFCPSCQA
jgi:formamidopyrimidine-DNA glycosylase